MGTMREVMLGLVGSKVTILRTAGLALHGRVLSAIGEDVVRLRGDDGGLTYVAMAHIVSVSVRETDE